MDDIFLKPYDPESVESDIYERWEKSGLFNPDICIEKGVCTSDAETFSIVLPPPNATGILHTGQALMITIEDIMVRFNRMQGKRTLWVPGTDHAAIATETKVDKELRKTEGTSRNELGREKFLEKVDEFVEDSRNTIRNQTRRMGASLDWSREAFTLDEAREKAVFEAFKEMYEAGLIYRGDRIVNWDPKGQTTVSDDEIERVEEKTNFYYFQYGPFVIGTARPETKFADKVVVVHPDDTRYAQYEHGQEFEIEWINGPITATLIKDEVADMEFGTGAMTITPWHSEIDFELAEKYELKKVQIIDTYGKLLPVAGEFEGMKIADAREKIVEKLEEKGLLVKVEDNHVHSKAVAQRSGGVIEPQIMRQWFVDVDKEFPFDSDKVDGISTGNPVTLKTLMRHVVEANQINILPDRFEKIYYNWIDNLHDWCISRQIWYGHQIPVWYQLDSDAYATYEKDPDAYAKVLRSATLNPVISFEKPEGDNWAQDPDTLDTWFSSGLWTFSTLGWPDETDDLKTYHPTDVLETGYDIIFFWVARMILMTTFLLGEIPFHTVYLHGLVRDERGRKISKSLGNAIDPIELVEKYGADALRMALIVGVGPGSDNNLGEDKIRAYKKFANKLWNITRFVLENTGDKKIDRPHILGKKHTYILARLDEVVREVTEMIQDYRYYLAAETLYHYVWHEFADEIIEQFKPILKEDEDVSEEERIQAAWLLQHMLRTSLVLLHPFMPYITEEIWHYIRESDELEFMMIHPWPQSSQ